MSTKHNHIIMPYMGKADLEGKGQSEGMFICLTTSAIQTCKDHAMNTLIRDKEHPVHKTTACRIPNIGIKIGVHSHTHAVVNSYLDLKIAVWQKL